MNLLRSFCCLFAGRCAGEEPKPTTEAVRGEPSAPKGDLGQKEAELEKAGKEQVATPLNTEDSFSALPAFGTRIGTAQRETGRTAPVSRRSVAIENP